MFDALGYAQICYERPYQKDTMNSFHNALHAADTLVCAGSILYTIHRNAFPIDYFRPELQYALGIAALFHDFHHPGVQADFLKHTREPTALRYEGNSLLERMHCAETLELLSKFKCLPEDDVQYSNFRKACTQMILATDFKRGHKTVASIRLAFPSLFPRRRRWSRSGGTVEHDRQRRSMDENFLSKMITNVTNMSRKTLQMRKVRVFFFICTHHYVVEEAHSKCFNDHSTYIRYQEWLPSNRARLHQNRTMHHCSSF